jgi:hypothetical protein
MDKVVQKIKEINKAEVNKQLAQQRAQRNPNKYEKGKGKYTRVIK